MEDSSGSAVQRLRQRFEVLDGLARAAPTGPVRPVAAGADSAGPAGRDALGAPTASVQLRRPAGTGSPAASSAGTGAGAKFAPAPRPAREGERAGPVMKSPAVGKRTPAVAINSGAITDAGRAGKADSPTVVANGSTNGSRSPRVARTAASPRCNGTAHPSESAAKTADTLPAPAPAPGSDRAPSPVAAPPCPAPPRPPKPGSDTSSASGDGDTEPGDYLVPDGVPPVPPREPLSPEWGPARSPLVRRSLPPPPSGASLQEQAWFHPVDRAGARALILRRGNGAFVVRPSQRGGASAPFALTLLHSGQVYNFNIRQRSDGRFALGYHKKDEASFRSVEELVRHHQREPISLPTKARTCLTWYPSGGGSGSGSGGGGSGSGSP